MDDILHIIIQAIAHTGLALLVLYLTWLIMRGLMSQDHSEGEQHHD